MTASAPSVPTGLALKNLLADGSADLSFFASTNASALKAGTYVGCVVGLTGSPQQVLALEAQLGRKCQSFRRYLFANGQDASIPLNADDTVMAFGGKLSAGNGGATVTGGRIPYMNMVPSTNGAAIQASLWGGTAPLPAASSSSFGGSRSNDVWTPLQIGQVDINGNVTGVRTTTVTATSGSKNITGTFTSADVGLPITNGTKIPTGAIIVSQTGSAAVLNQNATASGSVSVTLGAGVIDPLINQWVQAALAYPGQFFFNWNHEVDVAPPSAPSTAIWRTAYYGSGVPAIISAIQASGTPTVVPNAQLQTEAAARRYVIKKFRDAGVTNAIFPWIVSDFRGGPSANWYQQTYPGSAWCDCIGWDPYDHASPAGSGSAGTVSAQWYGDKGWYTGLNAEPFENNWQASHAYALNAIVIPAYPAWQASHAYTLGQLVIPATANGYVYQCTVAGSSGGSAPTWGTAVGTTFTDGGVTWTVATGHFYKCTTAGTSGGTQPNFPLTPGATVTDGGAVWTEQGLSAGGKPRVMGEVGTQYRTANASRANTAFADLVNAQQNYPRMKAWWYFGGTGGGSGWSDLHTLDSTGAITSTWDTASINKLKSTTTGLQNSLFLPDVTSGGSGVGGYRIYEDGGGSPIATISGNPASPSIHLTGLGAANTPHTLQAGAIDTSGTPLESPKSSPLGFTIPGVVIPPPPAPVITVTPAPLAPQALVQWPAVAGVGGYRVYRADSTDSGVTFGAPVPMRQLDAGSVSYQTTLLQAGPTFVYQFDVTALDPTGQVESVPSNVVTFTGASTNPQPQPVIVATPPTLDANAVATPTWTLPADPLITGVQIFINVDPNDPASVGATPDASLGSTATSWTDPHPLNSGETRTYNIVTITSAGAISATVADPVTAATTAVTAVLNVTPTTVALAADGSGATFTLDARGSSSSSGRPLLYTFSDDTGNPTVGPTPNGVLPRTVFAPGIYHEAALVSDGISTDIDTQQVLVTPANGSVVTPFLKNPLILQNQRTWSLDPSDAEVKQWFRDRAQEQLTIDAVLATLFAVPVSGDYVFPQWMTQPGTAPLGTGFNQVAHTVKLLVPGGQSFAAIGINLTVGGTTGTQTATFALYADDGTGRGPSGAQLASSVPVSLVAAAGWVEDPTFRWTPPAPVGNWSVVWASVLFTLTGVTAGTYATISTMLGSLIQPAPQVGGVVFPKGYSQPSLSSLPDPIVPASLARTASPAAIGLKAA